MPGYEALRINLERRGFETSFFATAAEACDYLNQKIDGKTVGIGGTQTVVQMGLGERLSAHNTVHSHWMGGSMEQAASAQVYLCSVNGLAETGEIINIDGTGNRLAALCFGPKQVLVLCSAGKIQPTTETAVSRARNTAAPVNALRFGGKTPCAADGLCHNCLSPDCICNQILLTRACRPAGRVHVFLIGEELGL